MANKPNRYKLMERYMTIILCIDTITFILYMIFAGLGVIWLKALLAIGCLVLSGYLLWILYVSKELHRQRSLWITTGAVAIAVCLLFSLILNFPSPNKYKPASQEKDSAYQVMQQI